MPKIIAGVRESATYRLKEVQRVWRKIHSPSPSEEFRDGEPVNCDRGFGLGFDPSRLKISLSDGNSAKEDPRATGEPQ
jgi:hypothetical protein